MKRTFRSRQTIYLQRQDEVRIIVTCRGDCSRGQYAPCPGAPLTIEYDKKNTRHGVVAPQTHFLRRPIYLISAAVLYVTHIIKMSPRKSPTTGTVGRYALALLLSGVPLALGSVVGRYAAVAPPGEQESERGTGDGWYESLEKPWYTPPPLAFSVVWPVLYVLMGVATFVAYAWGGRPLWIVYGALYLNLAFNLAFPIVQFRLRDLFWATVIVWVTLFTALVLMYAVTVDSKNAKAETVTLFLLLPYVSWLTFAVLLSTEVYIRNRL